MKITTDGNLPCRKWKDYMLLAEKEGIVTNGMRNSKIETATLKI